MYTVSITWLLRIHDHLSDLVHFTSGSWIPGSSNNSGSGRQILFIGLRQWLTYEPYGMTHSVVFIVETKHNSWGVIIWLIKCITCIKEVESQISFLSYHFAPNDFTHLKHQMTKIWAHTVHPIDKFGRWTKIIILRWTSGRIFDHGPWTSWTESNDRLRLTLRFLIRWTDSDDGR